MALNRAAIHYDNRILAAALTATSAASATMGVDKLKTPSPRERWRATGRVEETIIATTGNTEAWPAVFLWGHNLTAGGTVRLRISDNADLSSPKYDATFGAYPALFGLDEGGLDEGGLDGLPVVEAFEDWQKRSAFLLDLVLTGTATGGTATTITLPARLQKTTGGAEKASTTQDDYLGATLTITGGTGSGQVALVAAYDRQTRTITLDASLSPAPDSTSTFSLDLSYPLSVAANDGAYSGLYLGVTLADPENEDFYVQLGVLSAGGYLQPAYDIDVGFEAGWVDPSERAASYGNELFVDQRNMHQTLGLSWSYLSEAEANELVHTLGAKIGARKPVVAMPFFENGPRLFTDAIFGLLDRPPAKRLVRTRAAEASWQVSLSLRGL